MARQREEKEAIFPTQRVDRSRDQSGREPSNSRDYRRSPDRILETSKKLLNRQTAKAPETKPLFHGAIVITILDLGHPHDTRAVPDRVCYSLRITVQIVNSALDSFNSTIKNA
jgi:hypothetical protein